jgi:hypothetical protein
MLVQVAALIAALVCGVQGAEQPEGTAPPEDQAAPPQKLQEAPLHPQEVQPPTARSSELLSGTLKLEPRGVFIVNVPYNTGTLTPGSFVFYALPPGVSRSQYFISPSNTTLGFKLSGLTLIGAELSGGLDVTLRSPAPLAQSNTISPQFYSVYIQLEHDWWRAIVGQYPDVVLAFLPDTTNSYPSGYIPGSLGFARPQVRGDFRVWSGDSMQVIARASLGQPIQTFSLDPENSTVGRQGGLPDVQGRVSFGVGEVKQPWERAYEIGVAAHIGRRRMTVVQTLETRSYRSWSVSGDLRLRFPTGTVVKARVWRGTIVGDYMGAIFQTIDVTSQAAIPAVGFWAEVQQALTKDWRVTVGYGRDNPFDADLTPGDRSLNWAAFGNVFWDFSTRIGFAAEVSRWETSYLGDGTNRVWRSDVVFLLRF